MMQGPFSVGQRVRIMSGPFTAMTGKIVQVQRDKQAVTVAISPFFGRETTVMLHYRQVAKV